MFELLAHLGLFYPLELLCILVDWGQALPFLEVL